MRDNWAWTHNTRGAGGGVGLHRFPAGRRRYLLEVERELQRVDAILRPTATEKLGIPYWRWQDPFPTLMDGFLPANDPETELPPSPRKNAPPPNKTNPTDITPIVNHYPTQITGFA